MGFDSDVYVRNSLISVYGGCGRLVDALKVFDEMPGKDVDALALFQRMQIEGKVKPDEVTLLSVVSAISVIGALDLGKWVDAYVSKNGLALTVALGTALIDMFSRCGSINDSIRVFDRMPERNVRTWTALINGLAVHGRSREALELFHDMKKVGCLRYDHITFSAALVACSHGGLVNDGWRIFRSIKEEYGMEPNMENYGCMVDLLGRAGLLDDALKFVEQMPCKPNAIIWRTLLGACVNHNNTALADEVNNKLFHLDPYHDGDYVLLSNAYGGTGKYAKKAELRASMREKRISKEPGHSLLVVGDEIHEFFSGDDSHLESLEVRKFLQQIITDIRVEGYEPYTSNVFHDIEDEEKEQSIGFHSEKLAVAFALVSFTDSRRTIRIMKNLRTCRDCHSFMKRVSRKFDREIIVRDRNRFHHFRDGACSCQDYW
ncbi:Pentatricopeptide repeat-containing protein At4g21065 [Linum grandiflorum]